MEAPAMDYHQSGVVCAAFGRTGVEERLEERTVGRGHNADESGLISGAVLNSSLFIP